MITFRYRVNEDGKSIYWQCVWDGIHNDQHLPSDGTHPFSYTFEFKDDLELYNRYLCAFKKQKRKRVSIFCKQKDKGALFSQDKGLTRSEIEKLNPEHLRIIEETVAYNPATLGLCRLLYDHKNMASHSGYTDPYHYFKTALAALYQFWD